MTWNMCGAGDEIRALAVVLRAWHIHLVSKGETRTPCDIIYNIITVLYVYSLFTEKNINFNSKNHFIMIKTNYEQKRFENFLLLLISCFNRCKISTRDNLSLSVIICESKRYCSPPPPRDTRKTKNKKKTYPNRKMTTTTTNLTAHWHWNVKCFALASTHTQHAQV